MPSNLSSAHMARSNQVCMCASGASSSRANRRVKSPRPTRIDVGPWRSMGGCVRPGAGRLEFSRYNPRKMMGDLAQVQSKSVTSVNSRVSGSGCAKMRKTRAHTAPQAAQTGARRWTSHSLLIQTGLARRTQSWTLVGSDRPLTVGMPEPRMVAWRQATGFLPFQPEKAIDQLAQVQDDIVTSVDPRVSVSGCAKMRKTRAHTAPQAAQSGAKRWTKHCLRRRTWLGQRTRSQAPAGSDRPLTVGVPGPRMVARRQATDFLPFQPENSIDPLTQVQYGIITSVDPRVSGSRCAKTRKTGAHTAPEPAKRGAEAG
jgi:ribosomal protein S11